MTIFITFIGKGRRRVSGRFHRNGAVRVLQQAGKPIGRLFAGAQK